METASTLLHDELEVLESIYAQDFKKVVGVWGKESFELTLSSTKVVFKLDKAYPRVIPSLDIVSTVNDTTLPHVSTKDLAAVTASSQELMRSLVGSAMLYDVASHIEAFVKSHEKASIDLYETMVKRQEGEAEALKLLRQNNGVKPLSLDFVDHNSESSSLAPLPVSKHILPPTPTWAAITSQPRPTEERSNSVVAAAPSQSAATSRRKSWLTSFVNSGENTGFSSSSSDSEDEDDNDKSASETAERNSAQPQTGKNSSSRYWNEFIELNLLGQGAAGSVWKVRNKLDRRIYAVKKIAIDDALFRKIRREVTTISGLAHKYIVRYYSSWIEDGGAEDNSSGELDSADDDSSELSRSGLSGLSFGLGRWGTQDSHLMFHGSDSDSSSSSGTDADKPMNGAARRRRAGSQTKPPGEPKHKSKTLYLQMEYCTGTLRDLIDDGNIYANEERLLQIFRQMLEALHYFHGKGVIHRDLKPLNIFWHNSGVRIGDFGLASDSGKTKDRGEATSQDRDRDELVGSELESFQDDGSALTGGVGTSLYCAPEVLNARGGSGVTPYDFKADMYSMGIVLFEMSHPHFTTGSERVAVIRGLRDRAEFPADYRGSAAMRDAILWLTKKDPKQRPTAAEMLSSSLLPLPPLDLKDVTDALKHDTEATTSLVRSLFSEDFHSSSLASNASTRDQYSYDRDLLVSTVHALRPHAANGSRQSTHKRIDGSDGSRLLFPMQVREGLCHALHSLFHCRGAVQLLAPVLQLGPDPFAHQFFDRSGRLVSLQTNLLVNYARLVARSGICNVRRYQVGPVYKMGGAADQHPLQSIEAVYDITVGDATLSAQLVREAEADVLCASADIMQRTRLGSKAQLLVCDDRIIRAIADVCVWGEPLGALTPEAARDLCCDQLRGADAKLPSTVLARLAQFSKLLSAPGQDPMAVLGDLETLFFKSDAVLALQRQLTGSAPKKADTPAAVSTQVSATAPAPKADLSAALLLVGRPAPKARSEPRGDLLPPAQRGAEPDADGSFDKKDLKRYRATLKAFDAAVSQLKDALSHLKAQHQKRAATTPDYPPLLVSFTPTVDTSCFDREGLRFIWELGAGASRRKLLEGGHFSRLVTSFTDKDCRQNRAVSVGLRVNVDLLASAVVSHGGSARDADYDVVVALPYHGAAPSTLEDEVQLGVVLSQLRAARLRAISAQSLAPICSFKSLLALCARLGVGAVLTVSAADALHVHVFLPTQGGEASALVAAEQLPAYLSRELGTQVSTALPLTSLGTAPKVKASVKGAAATATAQAEAVMIVLSQVGLPRDKANSVKKARYEAKVSDFLHSLLGVRYRFVERRSSTTSGPVVLASDAKKVTLQRLCACVNALSANGADMPKGGLTVDAVGLPESEPDRKHIKIILGEIRPLRGCSVVLYSTVDDAYDILRL